MVVPRRVREQIGVANRRCTGSEGLKAQDRIILESKSIVDSAVGEGLEVEDIKRGRLGGPYRTVAEATNAFRERWAKLWAYT